jgi:hypothetical protein
VKPEPQRDAASMLSDADVLLDIIFKNCRKLDHFTTFLTIKYTNLQYITLNQKKKKLQPSCYLRL